MKFDDGTSLTYQDCLTIAAVILIWLGFEVLIVAIFAGKI